ncbi:MAG: hypothetical protein ACTHL1_00035 [Burkholderiaceae bacterium]
MKIAILIAVTCGLLSGCVVYEPAPYHVDRYPRYGHYDRNDHYDGDRERRGDRDDRRAEPRW